MLHPDQIALVTLLKKKGTGETMGKHLMDEDLALLPSLFASPNADLTTKATLWTAITMLSKTPEEAAWFSGLDRTVLPIELVFLDTPQTQFQHACAQAISGKAFSREETKTLALDILNPDIPDYEKAMFLEALRLKRETLDENLGFFDALYDSGFHGHTETACLIDLSLSYDGFSRTPLWAPFCAPLLAALGYPTLLHGTPGLGPKYGQTPADLLVAARKKIAESPHDVITDIENPNRGWGYLDQQYSHPKLHACKSLRNKMVKRPLLATLDKLLLPIQAKKTYLVTGYTHPPYRPLLCTLGQTAIPATAGLVLRGVEGSIQPPLDRRFPVTYWTKENETSYFNRGSDYGLVEQALPYGVIPDIRQVLNEGVDALCGKPGFAYDTLLLMAAMILTGFGFLSKKDAVDAIHSSLREGRALSRWT